MTHLEHAIAILESGNGPIHNMKIADMMNAMGIGVSYDTLRSTLSNDVKNNPDSKIVRVNGMGSGIFDLASRHSISDDLDDLEAKYGPHKSIDLKSQRKGQVKFANEVGELCNWHCIVFKTNFPTSAAHIIPYALRFKYEKELDCNIMDPCNGLYLDDDLHRAFDNDRIRMKPLHGKTVELQCDRRLNGHPLFDTLPREIELHPKVNMDFMQMRYENCNFKEAGAFAI